MQPTLQTADLNVWWRMIRPHTLTASFIPVFSGTAMAIFDNGFRPDMFLAMLLASLLIQAATNMINEYFDYVRGLDNPASVGIGGTIVRDGIAPKLVRNLAFFFYGLAVLLGIYICAGSSWWVALAGTVSILVSYFYSAGPLPISSTPFGELFSGLFMGPVIILITYFIQTGSLSAPVVFVSLSLGLLIGAINLSNNIRDKDGDKAHGRKTLAVLLGRPKAIVLLAATFTAAFVWIALLAATGYVTPWVLLVLLSVPKAVQAVRGFIGKETPFEMMPAMKSTAQLNTFFGLLLSIGFIIGFFVAP
jgi:1,4-dihydroxy-2-naphthoate octaprenyltransferase